MALRAAPCRVRRTERGVPAPPPGVGGGRDGTDLRGPGPVRAQSRRRLHRPAAGPPPPPAPVPRLALRESQRVHILRGAMKCRRGRRKARARSHCRFARPLIHFIPDLRTYSVPLFLKRHCDRTLRQALGADGEWANEYVARYQNCYKGPRAVRHFTRILILQKITK